MSLLLLLVPPPQSMNSQHLHYIANVIKDVLGRCFPMVLASRFFPEILILVFVAQGRCFPMVLAPFYCVTTRCAKTGGDIAVNAASWTLCAPEICSVMRFGCACSMRAALLGMEDQAYAETHVVSHAASEVLNVQTMHRHMQLGPQSRSMEEALSVLFRYEHQLHGSVHGHGQVFLAMQRRSPHVMRTDVD